MIFLKAIFTGMNNFINYLPQACANKIKKLKRMFKYEKSMSGRYYVSHNVAMLQITIDLERIFRKANWSLWNREDCHFIMNNSSITQVSIKQLLDLHPFAKTWECKDDRDIVLKWTWDSYGNSGKTQVVVGMLDGGLPERWERFSVESDGQWGQRSKYCYMAIQAFKDYIIPWRGHIQEYFR